jgi:hypothetical protein
MSLMMHYYQFLSKYFFAFLQQGAGTVLVKTNDGFMHFLLKQTDHGCLYL